MNYEINKSNFSKIRLRFAPSPTGYLHVGGARTALFNYLYAKANGGKFILRIEDTDRERSTEIATQQVLESMQWLGIDWDEGPGIGKNYKETNIGEYGPYFQSQRLKIYENKINKLLTSNNIYPCFCSDKELNFKRKQAEAMGIPYIYDRKCLGLSEVEIVDKKLQGKWIYRFKVNVNEVIFFDEIKGKIKFETKLIGDFVIVKSDGYPTYNFAVVVDDSMMKISHVIRGDDHISNTPRQILLYQALGEEIPKFHHISMILGKDGEKLSKRHGAVSVLDYRDSGYYPDPLINHLALLGWSPEDGKEVISRDKLNQSLINPKFSSSPSIFDKNKLDYLNGLYLRNLPSGKILIDLKKILTQKSVSLDHPKIDEILLTLKDYCKKLSDIEFYFNKFMAIKNFNSSNLLKANQNWMELDSSKKLFKSAYKLFNQKKTNFIDLNEFKILITNAKNEGIKGKQFFMPLRLKLTGESHGMELDKFLTLKLRKEILNLLL